MGGNEDILYQMEAMQAQIRRENQAYWEEIQRLLPRPFGATPKPRKEQLVEYQALLGADGKTWAERTAAMGMTPYQALVWHKEMQRLSQEEE